MPGTSYPGRVCVKSLPSERAGGMALAWETIDIAVGLVPVRVQERKPSHDSTAGW